MKQTRSRRFYAFLALAMSGTAYLGFYFTYLSLIATGNYPTVSAAIHIHGWSFFLWYLLFPFQAILIATGRRQLHVTLGYTSLGLASVMIFSGLLVASVRINATLASADPSAFDEFWGLFGLVITFGLILFTGFYVAAILYRKQSQVHKRLMVMASASALPAAVFRIIVAFGEYHWLETPAWVLPSAIFLPNVFICLGMVYDFLTRHSVHRTYVIGLPIAIGVEWFGLVLATNPAGDSLRQIMAMFSGLLGFH